MNNLTLKLVSLGAALAMFAFVQYYFVNSQSTSSSLQVVVPIELQNLSPNKIVLQPRDTQVQVSLRGPTLAIHRVVSNPPLLRIMLPDDVGIRHKVNLKRDDLKLPAEVEVLNIKPAEMEFVFDERSRKSLPVVVPQIGALPNSFRVVALKVFPEQIELTGPKSETRQIDRLETEPLDLRDITANVTRELSVRVPGVMSSLATDRVRVSLEVALEQSEKRFDKLKIEMRSFSDERYNLEPSQVSVTVSGAKSLIKDLKPSEVVPFIRAEENWAQDGWDASGMRQESVKVDLPKGLNLAAVEPQSINVRRAGASSTAVKPSAAAKPKTSSMQKKSAG